MDPSNLTPEHSNSARSTEAPLGSRTRPKQTIDDYEFVIDQNSKFKTSDLGSGAYGKVKRVREIATGQIYAMKIMDKTAVFRSSSKENLKNEIHIHKNIQHPHIIKLHNYFEDSDYVYIVMEYAENRSLYEFIRKGFAENEAFVFFFQTCLGLKYLHSKMIIHRDLKPENLLLDKENNVKICDFGWSTRGSNMRQTYCGTIDYMAPEIIKDLPYDHRVDVWSLGILLYELLHGCVPFFGQTDQQKTHSIASNTPIRFSPRISTEACNLITKILKPNPDDRLTLDDILMHPWMKKHEEVYDVNIQTYVEQQEIETKKTELLLHGNPDSGRGTRARQMNIVKGGLDMGEIKKKSSGEISTQPNSRSESEKNDVQNQIGNKKNKPLPGHGQASEYWWTSVDMPILGLKSGRTRKDDSLNEERGRDQYSIDSDPSEKKGSEMKRYSSMDRRGRGDGIEKKRTSKYFDMNLNVQQGNMGDIKGLNDIVFKNTEIERQLQSRKKDEGPNFFEQMLMGFGIISKNNNKGNEF